MQRMIKLIVLIAMVMSFSSIIAPSALFAANVVRMDCPIDKPVVDGDSVGIGIYITNDVTLGGFSLGFSYSSNDVEVTSVQQGPALVTGGFGNFLVQLKPAENKILTGWLNFTPAVPMPIHATEVLLMTLWVQVPIGTPAQCVNFDSVFVSPAGYFLFAPQAGGDIKAEYSDCGASELNIMGGCSGPANTDPVVSDIPDQTIAEGGAFSTIILDNFVSDAEDADETIIWSAASGAPNGFDVSINASRVATITYPGGDFSGAATFTFTATDPGGLFASNNATFTVTAVNDPPVVADIPNQTVAFEANFATVALDNFVSDPDNADNEMTWTYSGNMELTVSIDAGRVATINKPSTGWSGSETITFRATDPGTLFSEDAATFTVQTSVAVIVLNDDSLFYNGYQGGPNPVGQAIIITNGGNGTLNWSASESTDWLTLTSTSGAAPGGFTANVAISALTVGQHVASITITSPEASNSPQAVYVVVNIVDDVDILLSSDSLVFTTIVGNNPPSQQVNISNASPSGISFAWGAVETTPWLSLTPSSGTAPSTVDFNIDATGLLPGEYAAQVIFKQAAGLETGIDDDQDTVDVILFVDFSTDVDDIGGSLPTTFSLEQNFPNPFNPTTSIEFNLPKASYVNLSVFNILGQKVTELVNTTLSAGNKRIEWNGMDQNGRTVESGVYFYKISAEEFSMTRKMMMIK
ncbi:MAG: T9SS type A sorting domain-containing protein [Candidatus Zixiibacteriota bacterium]